LAFTSRSKGGQVIAWLGAILRKICTTFSNIGTRQNVPLKWTQECEQAFQTIKQKLVSPPILGTPDVDKGFFTATCYASLTGLGAVLTQEQDGKEVIIAYWSKLLNSAQRNYCATHRELLAFAESVKAFNHYLAYPISSSFKPCSSSVAQKLQKCRETVRCRVLCIQTSGT
jgi:hypothetical protein